MSQLVAPRLRASGLGPWFWTVTAILTLINVAISIFIVRMPIADYLSVAGTPAISIDNLFRFLSVVGNAIFVYVIGYLAYFTVVWRRPRNAEAGVIGIQAHDNKRLEFWWTLIPTLLIVVLAVVSVRIWYEVNNTLGGVLTMEAIGHQFNYEFRYPRLKQSVFNEMHLPIGTPVSLHVTSDDVIHSFWVPEFRIKYDMVPGLVQTLNFTPERIGTYRILCTEFCGKNHAGMVAILHIDSQQDFGRWLAAQYKAQGAPNAGPIPISQGSADAGKVLFGQKCSACHSLGPYEQKIVGPGLGKIFNDPAHPNLVTGKPATPEHVAEILKLGYSGELGVMPNAQANAISNKDIANLVAYLVSVSKQ